MAALPFLEPFEYWIGPDAVLKHGEEQDPAAVTPMLTLIGDVLKAQSAISCASPRFRTASGPIPYSNGSRKGRAAICAVSFNRVKRQKGFADCV